MTAILLIAANYMREQRWVIVGMAAWLTMMALVVGETAHWRDSEELFFYLQQQAGYGILFVVLLAGAAIHNERRSRRILGVLSKAVSRRQYLAGLLAGVLGVIGVYCGMLWVSASWLALAFGLQPRGILPLIIVVLAGAALVAALTMLFATFLHPLIAAGATAVTLGISAGLARSVPELGLLLPLWHLGENLARFSFASSWQPEWALIGVAILESVLLWLAASRIFSRRDVAAAVE